MTEDPPPKSPGRPTVRQLVRTRYHDLTRSERKFANALVEDYPNAGLASITAAAEGAGVSAPVVARMVQKLGFKGYPQFHQALLEELQASVSGPTARRAVWTAEAPATHMLNRFAGSVTQNLAQTFANIDPARFDAAARMLAGDAQLFIVGGRITRSLAEYAFTHFQAIRPRVTHLTSAPATWPHYVLDMVAGDTLLIFDIRRYEDNLLRLAEIASTRGVRAILITDQWASPVATLADATFHCWGEIPSAWESNIAMLSLTEALIAATQEECWPGARARFDQLDRLFEMTRLFRKV
ncbi:MurR/RpiR family transcriptional regulator [Roseovarius sp. D22-M7]|uniref:MurR/RpiR family transcriptional regulator n=1 Tax=Roseovarius sp. D22-M7 TaxID=3127116 RepID=UPI00300FAD84